MLRCWEMSILAVWTHVHITLLIFSLVSLVLMNVFISFSGKHPQIIKPIFIFCQCWGASIVPAKFAFQHPVTHPNVQWHMKSSWQLCRTKATVQLEVLVHCHKFWLPCSFPPPFTFKRAYHMDWQNKEWEKGNTVPVSLEGTIAQTISSVYLRWCESELWTAVEWVWEHPLLSFPHSWDSHGFDVTERVVHQPCGQPLDRGASQGPLGLFRDINLHLLVIHSVAILSTEDLQITDSAAK